MCSLNPSLLRGKLRAGSSFPLHDALPGLGFIMRVYLDLSYPVQCSYFLSHRSHSASFLIFLRGNYSTCSCTLGAYIGKGKFKPPLLSSWSGVTPSIYYE